MLDRIYVDDTVRGLRPDFAVLLMTAEGLTNAPSAGDVPHPGDLAAADTTFKGGTKKIRDGLTGGDLFTCASCHDVHNKDNAKNTLSTSSRNYFLLGDNNNSDFCTSCHLK